MARGMVAAVVFPKRSMLMIYPLQRQAQALRGRENDALVRLMRDEAAEITYGDVVSL